MSKSEYVRDGIAVVERIAKGSEWEVVAAFSAPSRERMGLAFEAIALDARSGQSGPWRIIFLCPSGHITALWSGTLAWKQVNVEFVATGSDLRRLADL